MIVLDRVKYKSIYEAEIQGEQETPPLQVNCANPIYAN
jgi:hypothetical protein